MRGTRRNRRHHKGKDKLVTTVTFFIIAPILGIVIGVFLVNNILLPRLPGGDDLQPVGQYETSPEQEPQTDAGNEETETASNSTTSDNETQPSYEAKLQDVQLYSVQVGSFSDVANAREFLNEIKENGLSGYIFKRDDYKVFAGAFLTREDGEAYKVIVKEIYGDSFISEKVVQGSVISYRKEEYEAMKALGKVIEALHTSYQDESKMWVKVFNAGDIEGLKSKMALHNKTIEDHMKVLNESQMNEEIKVLQEGIQDQLEKRVALVSKLEKKILVENYSEFNAMLIDFVNLIKADD